MIKRVAIIFICLVSLSSLAQKSIKDSIIGTPWVAVQYSFNVPGGDLMHRFGINHSIGMKIAYKDKRNWVYGVEGNFIFGNKFKQKSIFDDFYDSQGNISDINGQPADVFFYMRGFNVNAIGGKVFPWFGPNKNSGMLFELGLGFLYHKIRIETQDHVVPQLELDYKKGYDRLTYGTNLSQFVGYVFMANNNAVNFYAGLYAMQGFTKNRRPINFDTKLPDNELKIDLQFGVKLGWIIPIYKRASKRRYF